MAANSTSPRLPFRPQRRGPTAAQPEPGPRDALATMRAWAAPRRWRVIRDAEGWPIIPGRYGRLEWYDGTTFAVYTDRPRLFVRLWALPGVRRWQIGDQEMRALLPVEALEPVTGVIRARRRRSASTAAHLQKAPDPPVQRDFSGVGARLVPGAGSR